MKALVIYDSAYGNTEKIAVAVKDALAPFTEVRLLLVTNARVEDVETSDIVFVGSPTQGGRATDQIQKFIEQLPDEVVANKPFAVFDTRFAKSEHGMFLKIVMKTVGFAAPKMAHTLKKKGALLVHPAEGFIVADTKGPLEGKELARAFGWAQATLASCKQGSEFMK